MSRPKIAHPLDSHYESRHKQQQQLRIKATASVLTAISICLWMDHILLRLMRVDGVQMVSYVCTRIAFEIRWNQIDQMARFARGCILLPFIFPCPPPPPN